MSVPPNIVRTFFFLLDFNLNMLKIDCQSLRADPFYPFTFSTLIASKTEYRPLELTEINLLQAPNQFL